MPAGSSPPSSRPRAEAGRAIDDDHYGAGFPFRFGAADDPARRARHSTPTRKRTGRDPARYFAIGDAEAILATHRRLCRSRHLEIHPAPVGRDDDAILAQTRRLIEEVLPLVAARWPKTGKTADAKAAAR